MYGLANTLLEQHDLISQGWTFRLDNSKHRVGQCDYEARVISFSVHYLPQTSLNEIRDTILHEIAHALVGSGHGHNYVWKAMCRQIGARPERLANEEAISSAKHNFIIECPACGKQWPRYRLRKSLVGQVSVCCEAELKFYKSNERLP